RWARAAKLGTHAAEEGHLDLLEWMERDIEWAPLIPTKICSIAAGKGHLAIVRWGHERGFPMDGVVTEAASGGYINILEFAAHVGCLWDGSDQINAARGGHLEVLQWAKD